MATPSTRKSAKLHLEKDFNKAIRERDTKIFGKCPLCSLRGTNNPIEDCGHWQTAAWESTKFDPENCTGICKSCNIMMEHDSDFKVRCVAWYKFNYGVDKWDAMVVRSHDPAHFGKIDFEEMRQILKSTGIEGYSEYYKKNWYPIKAKDITGA